MSVKIILVLFMSALQRFSICRESHNVEVFLKNELEKIPLEQFESDLKVMQSVDQSDNITTYSFLNGEYFLDRDGDESKMDVVVTYRVSPGTIDYNLVNETKRVWTVLRKIRKAGENIYAVVTGGMRPVSEADDKVSTYISDETKLVVEWYPFFEDFEKELQGYCASSFLTPCFFNDSVTSPGHRHQVQVSLNFHPTILENIFKDKDYYPLLGDLETNQIKGRVIGSLVGHAVGGAFALLCQVVSVIFRSGCKNALLEGFDNPDYEESLLETEKEEENNDMFIIRKKRNSPIPAEKAKLQARIRYTGWKTQFIEPKKGIVRRETKKVPFYGFGNCPPVPEDSLRADDPAIYYCQILRCDCFTMFPLIVEIIQRYNYSVEDVGAKTFSLNYNHPSLMARKVSEQESILISVAFQLSIFSNLFQKLLAGKKLSDWIPDGKQQLSITVAFLLSFGEEALKEIKSKISGHRIILLRRLVQHFKDVRKKVEEDIAILTSSQCLDCETDLQVMKNDSEALLLFIIYLIRAGGKDGSAFQDFFSKYRDIIHN